MEDVTMGTRTLKQDLIACTTPGLPNLERVHYFARQLITPDDLIQEQEYFRDKLRRHNRLLHGWGIVCGARVRRGQGECEIVVEPGYVLGPYGDEIVIDQEVILDLCRKNPECGVDVDPWCSSVPTDGAGRQILCIAVRYVECQSRPVRVQMAGCGCDDITCEYSRIRDSFEIQALGDLPNSYKKMPEPRCASRNCIPVCPSCPTDPWVVLACVVLVNGTIDAIDCDTHRRYVWSFADCYFRCGRRQTSPSFDPTHLSRWVSVAGEDEDADPITVVSMVASDGGTLMMPVYFAIKSGETFADFLAREGNLELSDSATDETFELRDLYAMAGVDINETIDSVNEAVLPLEGLRLQLTKLQVMRSSLRDILDETGMEHLQEEYAGSPAFVPNLPAIDISGISPRSKFGKRLAKMTVRDVAGMSRSEFVAMALESVSQRQQKAVTRQAREIWARAARADRLSQVWQDR